MSAEPASTAWPRICVVGPLPPPSGGMANQCEQLVRLLAVDGVRVALVRTNCALSDQSGWAGFRWCARCFACFPTWGGFGRRWARRDLVHVLSNSGWAWHLLTTPVLVIASIRRQPVIVNYRGGNADSFFRKSAPACSGLAATCRTASDALGLLAARIPGARVRCGDRPQHRRSHPLRALTAQDRSATRRIWW